MKRSRLKRWLFILCSAPVLGLFLGTAVIVIDGLNDRLGKADVALVLGNTVESDGKPSRRLQARLDRTVQLYKEGDFPLVIASGGVGKEGYDEGVVMRDYLVAQGIPAGSVLVDSQGTTTWASARNTLQIVRERRLTSVLVVSQYFHLPRARLALRRFGVEAVYSAHAFFFEARDGYSSVREVFGYGQYLWQETNAGEGKAD